jgi:hypothetical protein
MTVLQFKILLGVKDTKQRNNRAAGYQECNASVLSLSQQASMLNIDISSNEPLLNQSINQSINGHQDHQDHHRRPASPALLAVADSPDTHPAAVHSPVETGRHTVRLVGDSPAAEEEGGTREVLRMAAGHSLLLVVVPEAVDSPAVEGRLRMGAGHMGLLLVVAVVLRREVWVVLLPAVRGFLHRGRQDGLGVRGQGVGESRTGLGSGRVGCAVLGSIGLRVLRRCSLLCRWMKSIQIRCLIGRAAGRGVSIVDIMRGREV